MPRVLLLIPSSSYRASDFIEAARGLEFDVVVGSDQRPVLASLAPGRAVHLDLATPEAGARQILDFVREHPIDSVVAVDDGGTLVASLAAERLGLPHNSFSGVEATRNKHMLRQRLARAELLSPDYRVISVDDDPETAAAEFEARGMFPCVVKPLALSGSRGVMRADDRAGFVRAFERLRALLSDPKIAADCGETAGQVLVEGYIPGDEIALEGVLDEGSLRVLAIFDKPDPLVGPFFEETIYVTPSQLPAETQSEVAEATERSARALGLRDGPIHAEFRINEEGAWPIDVAARSIGGLCSRTLTFGAGMSLEELLVRHATGAEVPTYEREPGASGVIMIPIPSAGTLTDIRGIEAAEAVPHVTDVTITMRPGQNVVPLPEGGEYLGFIFARAEHPDQVVAALRESHDALEFEITPPDDRATP